MWTSGTPSWWRLARLGVWVEGCAEGLGYEWIDSTLAEPVLGLPPLAQWQILSHAAAADHWPAGEVIGTYHLPEVSSQAIPQPGGGHPRVLGERHAVQPALVTLARLGPSCVRPWQDGEADPRRREQRPDSVSFRSRVATMATDRTREARYGLTLRRLRQDRHIRELDARSARVRDAAHPAAVRGRGLASREAVPGTDRRLPRTPDSLLKQVEQDLERASTSSCCSACRARSAATDIRFRLHRWPDRGAAQALRCTTCGSPSTCACAPSHARPLRHSQSRAGSCRSTMRRSSELARAALEYAQAGANCVAPSDMMDGRVAAIRQALDDARLRTHAAHELLGQVSLALLRSVSRGGRFGAARRRLKDRATYQIDPARADRCVPQLAARRRRRRGHPDGQTRPALSRHAARSVDAHSATLGGV